MQHAPRTLTQRRLDIGLLVLAVFTVAAVIAALIWDSRPAQSAGESRYVPPVIELPQDTRERALFIGDSYTAGAHAKDLPKRWTTAASRELGWIEKNAAAGGTGYVMSVTGATSKQACAKDYCPTYTEALTEYDGDTPDVVVLSGGRNDTKLDDLSGYGDAVGDTIDTAQKEFPDATIYVTSPVWDDDEVTAHMSELIDIVRAEAKEQKVTYLDIGQPLAGNEDMVDDDGVHPNNEGHLAIAAAFVEAVEG